MTPPSIVGAVVGALLTDECRRTPARAIAAILAWNGLDLLVRPFATKSPEPQITPAVVFGFLIGILGGAVGVILGTLRMPALLRGVGLTAKRAVGTNLVSASPSAPSPSCRTRSSDVDWPILAAGIAGALPGGWFGARLTGRIGEATLRRAIGIALLVISLAFLAEVVFG